MLSSYISCYTQYHTKNEYIKQLESEIKHIFLRTRELVKQSLAFYGL